MSNEDPVCPCCGSKLEKKGWVDRVRKKVGGEKEWLRIECRKCTNKSCGRAHRLLPECSVPYKHYEADLIEDVACGVITEEDVKENCPADITLQRWRRWAKQLLTDAEGKLRSAAYRALDLSDRFLGSRESLLGRLEERVEAGWLKIAIWIMYKTGGG